MSVNENQPVYRGEQTADMVFGGGGGTVTSVGLALPAEFTVSGSPVVAAGTLTGAWATQVANLVFAGPGSGGPAVPTFRALVSNDIPNLDASKITSGTFGAARIPTPTATTIEAALGSPASSGRFTITDAAISGTSKVLCWQAPGPYTGKGTRADEAEMQPVQVVAVNPAAGSATVYWQTPPMIASRIEPNDSPGRDGQTAASFPQMSKMLPRAAIPTRIGKASGNVKFSYFVFA